MKHLSEAVWQFVSWALCSIFVDSGSPEIMTSSGFSVSAPQHFSLVNKQILNLKFSLCRCSQDFLKQGETVSTRCDELPSLKSRGCNVRMIENPRGEQTVLRNKPVTNRRKGAEKLRPEDITQIQPQKFSLTLRSGEQ